MADNEGLMPPPPPPPPAGYPVPPSALPPVRPASGLGTGSEWWYSWWFLFIVFLTFWPAAVVLLVIHPGLDTGGKWKWAGLAFAATLALNLVFGILVAILMVLGAWS